VTIDWHPLREALRACADAQIAVPFWWRDDDAVSPTPALDQLDGMADRLGMNVHLAVIPAQAEATLAERTAGSRLIPVVHGWAHADHSGPDEKKNEFLTPRAEARTDAAGGFERMASLFGIQLRPMFVPPWNRVHGDVVNTLSSMGYTTLSTFGPRASPSAAPGLRQINTHIDPIRWKGSRDLVEPDHLIAQAAAQLHARRQGQEDAAEPLGLLTHHLVHTPAIWSFAEGFAHEMLSGGAVPWTMETTTE